MRWTKYDRANEREKDSLLEGVKKLMFDISDKNTKNIETVVRSRAVTCPVLLTFSRITRIFKINSVFTQ